MGAKSSYPRNEQKEPAMYFFYKNRTEKIEWPDLSSTTMGMLSRVGMEDLLSWGPDLAFWGTPGTFFDDRSLILEEEEGSSSESWFDGS